MRILHTAATYSPSLDGVAEVVTNISERLAKRGHDIHVATSAFDSHGTSEKYRGVYIHRFSAKGNSVSGMHGQVEEYRAFVGSGDWDIVVNHCLQTWPTDAILSSVKDYRWPSVLVTHGLSIDTGAFKDYYLDIPRHIATYRSWIRVSKVSEELSFAKEFRLQVPPVITNGVDMEEWTRPSIDLRRTWGIGHKPWVVNVSNHNPLKNHRDFFRLANKLKEIGAHFTLIGGSHPMNKWALGRMGISGGCAYECQLRSALSMGAMDLKMHLPRNQVVSVIKEADVVVSTSRWEANSVVLLESMAAGTPWVSFDVGSASENSGGVVANNLDAMANVVAELLRDGNRRKCLGRSGRARAIANHDWESITDQYEQLYTDLVGNELRACSS